MEIFEVVFTSKLVFYYCSCLLFVVVIPKDLYNDMDFENFGLPYIFSSLHKGF